METVITQYGNRLRVRVCGLCRQANSLLLVQHRGMLNGSGIFWSPPGGGVEYGESAIEALKREFQEETHLHISVGRFLFINEFLQPPLHAIELFFEVHIVAGNLQAGHDPETTENLIETVKWLDFKEIKTIKNEELHQVFHNCTNLDDIFLRQSNFHLPNGSTNWAKNPTFVFSTTLMEQSMLLSETSTNPNVYQSPTFSTAVLRGSNLYWLWQEGSVVCMVQNALGAYEYVEIFPIATGSDALTAMQENIGLHEFLSKNSWRKVYLTVSNQSFTQIPQAIFRKEYAARYLQLAKGKLLDTNEILHTAPLTEANLVTIFSLSKRVNDWLADLYSFQDIEVKHQSSELIKKAIQLPDFQGIVYFEYQSFTLVIAENGKLQFCNRFAFKTPQDLAYYLLFVMNELSILPSGMPLTIYGNIDETSEEFWEIRKYFKQILWGKSEHILNFEGILAHRFI